MNTKKPRKKPVKPRKKKRPRSEKKILSDELDHLGSQVCRKLWQGYCALCGGPGNQQHHYFPKKVYPWLRWDQDNLVWTCWQCHICRIHRGGEGERARDAIIKRIGQDGFDRLKERSVKHRKLSLTDLDLIKADLIMLSGLP